MNILLFSNIDSPWNGARPEVETFIGIAQRGHGVYVCTKAGAVNTPRIKAEGIKVFEIYPRAKVCLKTIFALRRVIVEKKIDIVFATSSRTIPSAAFACIGLPVKMVNYRGTSKGLYRHDPSAYLTHLHPRVDGIACNAEAVRQNVLKRVWKNRDCVRTIYKGQEASWFSQEPADLSEWGIPESAIVLTCVANSRPSKGIRYLLDASFFLADISQLYILVVGQNTDGAEFVDLKEKSPMGERIILAGFRSDAPQIIRAGDIYAQPSIAGEGMAKTIIEAMAQGIPAVVTTAGGNAEVIVDGESGYVVPVEDSKAMAHRIRCLAQDSDLRNSMGKASQRRIRDEFSVQKSVDGYIEFFNYLLNREI